MGEGLAAAKVIPLQAPKVHREPRGHSPVDPWGVFFLVILLSVIKMRGIFDLKFVRYTLLHYCDLSQIFFRMKTSFNVFTSLHLASGSGQRLLTFSRLSIPQHYTSLHCVNYC